jgi:uncharacterized protein YndB with AHSA1/START domain
LTDGLVEREVELHAPAAAVWRALTRGTELSGWFGARVELEPRPGGRASFRWPDGSEREARIEVFEPERHLLLRWLPFERDGRGAQTVKPAGQVRFLLEDRGDRTLLKVTETTAGSDMLSATGAQQGTPA